MQQNTSHCAHPLTPAVPVPPSGGISESGGHEVRWGSVAPFRSMPFANLASWERWLRVLLGALLLVVGWGTELPELAGLALRVFGWIPILTGLLGWSPLYSLLDITTRPTDLENP